MLSYQTLFIRAKNVLKLRYNIDFLNWLDENHREIVSSWLLSSLELKMSEKISKPELQPFLELMRRNSPTKFYMLEQDLIMFIRKEMKSVSVREIKQKVEEIDLAKVIDDDDDDFEAPSDASGYIYS